MAMMREGASADAETDQYRVYQYIIGELESGNYLRLMVQASARCLVAILCSDTSSCLCTLLTRWRRLLAHMRLALENHSC